jgi:hypothetical protein
MNTLNEKWHEIGIKEKMQIVNGTSLTFAAIALYFLAFFLTYTVGYPVVSAGATMLGAALAFFGIMAFVKSQMIHFETSVDEKIKQLENKEAKGNR